MEVTSVMEKPTPAHSRATTDVVDQNFATHAPQAMDNLQPPVVRPRRPPSRRLMSKDAAANPPATEAPLLGNDDRHQDAITAEPAPQAMTAKSLVAAEYEDEVENKRRSRRNKSVKRTQSAEHDTLEAEPLVHEVTEPEEALSNGGADDESDEVATVTPRAVTPQKSGASLAVHLSDSLYRRICTKAQQEGVSIQDFATELLAEGLVLRAWEIMERKSAMRQGNNASFNQRSGNGPSYGNRPNHQGPNRGGKARVGRLTHDQYQSIMEDKAAFLEYVRNQERKNR